MCADIVEQGDEIISVGQLNQQAKKLLEMFSRNFEKYLPFIDQDVKAAVLG